MSRKSPAEFSELLAQTPTPESPAELDERILEYARRHAPQPSRVRQPLFLTAAATLSVACIGLLVVLRSGDPTLPVNRSQPVPLARPAADWHNAQAISDSATEQSDEMLATLSRAEPEHGTSTRQLTDSKQTSAERKPDLAAAEQTRSSAQEFSGLMRKQAPSVPGAPIPNAAETTVLEDAPAMTAPQSLEQATVHDALLADDKKPETRARHAKFMINDKDVRESLQAIRKLHADGKKSEAEKAYRELREQCEGCELPVSLTHALRALDKGQRK